MMEKMTRLGFSVSTSVIRGEGWFYFLFYSVKNCGRRGVVSPGRRKLVDGK